MLGLSIYRVEGEFPANRDLSGRFRDFRFIPPEGEGEGEVVFRAPRTMRIHQTNILYVASQESFPDEGKRLSIEGGRIIEEPNAIQREIYSRVFVCQSANQAFHGKLFIQFISEYRKTPRGLLLDALSALFVGAARAGAGPRVVAVGYDVDCVAKRFPQNIWDENFHRAGRVQRGRIAGRQVDRDPAAAGLRQGKTYVGVEIPVQNSVEKVRVYNRGSITFMGVRGEDFHAAATERAAIEKILLVVERLRPCEV